MGTGPINLVEKGAGDAARGILVHREESGPVLAIPAFHRLGSISVAELRFLCIRRAECAGGILQSAKANSFEQEHVQRRNGLDRNHRGCDPEVQVCVWEM